MTMLNSAVSRAVFFLLLVSPTHSFAPALSTSPTTSAPLFAKRRGKSAKAFGELGTTKPSKTSTQSSISWIPTPVATKALPPTENQVGLIETNLPTLKNAQTNPAGAVAVTKFQGSVYCFDVQCPSCRIPLTKAQCTLDEDGKPVLVCDFCKSTYKLEQGGERAEQSAVEPGFFGSIAMNVFASQKEKGPLKLYKLGEKKGKVMIALD